MKLRAIDVTLLCVGLLIVACSPDAIQDETLDVTAPSVVETPIVSASTPDSTQEPVVITLDIWWPDRLSSVDDAFVSDLLSQQIDAFRASESNLEIEFRLKRSQDVGGILSTLRTASSVAPNALPDITLIRREDLLSAAQAGLIQPLEGLVSSTLMTELYPAALQLGRVQIGDQISPQLYGIAYLLDVQVMAYQADTETDEIASWTFNDMLERNMSYAFSAARSTGIPDSFLVQYLAAGGELSPLGSVSIDSDALESVLEFYEIAIEEGIISSDTATYSSTADYLPQLIDGTLDSGIINVSSFASLYQSNPNLQLGLIPTATNEPSSILNGWLWVIVTPNTDQQVLSARFINWMMDIDRQAEYSDAVHILPSQQRALNQWNTSFMDVELLDRILVNAILAPVEGLNNPVYRAMQTALISVLNGESTARDAARSIRNQLSG